MAGERSALQGVLRAVNDRGVVVESEGDIYFYPWSGITRIHLGAVSEQTGRTVDRDY